MKYRIRYERKDMNDNIIEYGVILTDDKLKNMSAYRMMSMINKQKNGT